MKRVLVAVVGLIVLGSSLSAKTTIPWRGGPVLQNVRVVAVYWGTPDPDFRAYMDRFYAQLTSSAYLTGLAEYATGAVVRKATFAPAFREWFGFPERQRIGTGSFAGSYVIKSGSAGVSGTTDIGPELDHQIHIGRIPPPDRGTVYMVHFAPAWSIYMGTNILGIPVGQWAGNGFCGYHAAYYSAFTSRAIVFAALPAQARLANCVGREPIEAETTLASHELVEAITDPGSAVHFGGFLSTGISSDDQAWAIPRGAFGLNPDEVVDGCGDGRLRTSSQDVYRVARVWRNSLSRCVLSPPVGTLEVPWRDATGTVRIRGWAVDPESSASPIEVHLYVDGPYPHGRGLAVVANVSRPDVAAATGFAGAHGFDVPVPAEFLDGRTHTIYAYAIGVTPGNNALLDNVAVTINSAELNPGAPGAVRIASEQDPNQCLDVTGYGREPGTPLQMYQCHGEVNQRFWYDQASRTLAVYDDRSMCLDAAGGDGRNGDSLIIWPCHGEPNQQWTIDAVSGEIRGVADKCLDARDWSVANGAGVQLWTCHGGTNQRWFRK